jgi:hypothetical protein
MNTIPKFRFSSDYMGASCHVRTSSARMLFSLLVLTLDSNGSAAVVRRHLCDNIHDRLQIPL